MRWWPKSVSHSSGRSASAGDSSKPHSEPRPGITVERQEIVDGLMGHLGTICRARGKSESGFDPSVDLYDAGYLDSISVSEFLLLAEKEFDVRLPDWLIGQRANSLEALARYIEEERRGLGLRGTQP